jgi:hypothetical protein
MASKQHSYRKSGIKLEIGRPHEFPERLNVGEYERHDRRGNIVDRYDAEDVCVTFRFYPGGLNRKPKLVEYEEWPRVKHPGLQRVKDMAIAAAATAAILHALNVAERVNVLTAAL